MRQNAKMTVQSKDGIVELRATFGGASSVVRLTVENAYKLAQDLFLEAGVTEQMNERGLY